MNYKITEAHIIVCPQKVGESVIDWKPCKETVTLSKDIRTREICIYVKCPSTIYSLIYIIRTNYV